MRRGKDWCIVRTAGQRTLPLYRWLIDAGYDAWTPVGLIARTAPRTKVKREIEVPMAPTFVFVRADRLPDLLRLLRLPSSAHPAFSIFQWGGRVPIVADREIEGLRAADHHLAEQRRKDVAAAHAALRAPYTPGDRITVPSGAFSGMTGVVQHSDGKHTLIGFGGFLDGVAIETFLLREEGVVGERSLAA